MRRADRALDELSLPCGRCLSMALTSVCVGPRRRVGLLAVADPLKPEAAGVVAALRKK
jgi:hypothetical protein